MSATWLREAKLMPHFSTTNDLQIHRINEKSMQCLFTRVFDCLCIVVQLDHCVDRFNMSMRPEHSCLLKS